MDKAVFKKAWPYQEDKMNLPVANVEAAIPFYEEILRFKVLSRQTSPFTSAVLGRDDIQIAIAENGGDPTQDGVFF
ncbi:MAG TPA: VOC family protein [Flavitalea sp.]|nr:VOC family protein [Flavitalea sp.]